jgi:hypothetical protein
MRSFFLSLLASSALWGQSQQLFNGKDLAGWTMVGPGRFVVEEGMLKTEGGMGLLFYSGRKVGNETLRVVFKTASARANSGVFIRLPEMPLDPWFGVHNGYEVQIDAGGDDWHSTGAIYSLSKVTKRNQKPQGEWNTMEIQLEGQTTRISVNGEVVNTFEGKGSVPDRKQWFEPVRGPRPNSGYIGLQNHDAESVVFFKEISLIPATGGAQPMKKGERDRILSSYHGTRKQVLDAVSGLSEAQWTFKPQEGGSSIREIFEYLLAEEDVLFDRLRAALTDGGASSSPKNKVLSAEVLLQSATQQASKRNTPGVSPTQGRWATSRDAVSAFQAHRDAHLDYLRTTNDALTTSFVDHAEGSASVYDELMTIPARSESHVAAIIKIKAGAGFPAR